MTANKHASIAYEVEGHPNLHCTVLYLGEIVDDKVQGINFKEVRECLRHFYLNSALKVHTTGLHWFGPNGDVPVVGVEHDLLGDVRADLLTAFRNGSQFKEYSPHITVPSFDYELPSFLWLDGLHLSWGDEEKVYLQ